MAWFIDPICDGCGAALDTPLNARTIEDAITELNASRDWVASDIGGTWCGDCAVSLPRGRVFRRLGLA